MKLPTIDELAAALDAAGEFEGFVAVCAFAGLRLGEAAGLQLGDVNFLGRSITVARQVQGSTIKAAKLVPPKAGSERTIFVPDALMELLAVHVAEQRLTRPDDQLFTDVFGRLWNRNNAGEQWRRIRTAARLSDDLTLHALRRRSRRTSSHRGATLSPCNGRSGTRSHPSPSTSTATCGRRRGNSQSVS